MGDAQRIFLRGGLIEEGRPPRQVPRCHLRSRRIGNPGHEDLGVSPWHTVEPLPITVFRHDETFHAIIFIVGAPEVLPVGGFLKISSGDIVIAQALSHLCDAIVVVSILDGSCAGTVDAIRDIAQGVVFGKTTPTLFLLIATRRYGGVLEHRLESPFIVDAFKPFHACVGNHHLGIASTLGTPVAVAAPRLGQIALAAVDIEHGEDDVALTLRGNEGEEGRRGAVGVPDCVIVVVIRQVAPFRVFPTTVHRHEHRVVQGGVEHPALLSGGIVEPDGCHLLLPCCPECIKLLGERILADVPRCLHGTDKRDAYLHVDTGVAEDESGLSTAIAKQHAEGLIGFQTEKHGIGIAIVPSTPDGGIAPYLVVSRPLYLAIHKLLCLAQVGHLTLA